MQPLLTVIIPHRNDLLRLRRLLSSIELQSHDLGDIEVVVVDDRSSIDQKPHRLQDNYAFLECLESKGQNAGDARNLGLSYAKGQWIVFADSDDYFVNFSQLLTSAKNLSNDVDLVYFDVSSEHDGTSNMSSRHLKYSMLLYEFIQNPKLDNIRYQHSVPWGKLVKCNLIKGKGLEFDSLLASNDICFSLKAGVFARRIDYIESVHYVVTESEGTLTSSLNARKSRARLKATLNYNKFLIDNGCSEKWILVAPRLIVNEIIPPYSKDSLWLVIRAIYYFFRRFLVSLFNR